jgi:hopanoid biosynthesis associated radical SAM protein HpnH
VAVPLRQAIQVGAYVIGQHLKGVRRYPLVLMLEPLFRCNLACAGCGKIDYPDPILNQRLSVDECLDAVDECGAPVVVLAGGEPLLHREIDKIAAGIIARKKFVYLCTNALLLEKKIEQFSPSTYFAWTVHLDGDRDDHDRSVCQGGVYDRAVAAIELAKARGFRVNINATLFDTAEPDRVARFFDAVTEIGIDGITVSPGYAYERAPDQEHFLSRRRTKELFRGIFARGARRWSFNQSVLFLDFLAGNQSYHCTPWGNPTRNYFGWQRPCYLLGEGYAKTFKQLMEETDWNAYGTGNYEKCANCMVHSGYEATAVMASVRNPLKAAAVALRGIRTEGEMAAEIPLDRQRPARFVFSRHVEDAMARLGSGKEPVQSSRGPISADSATAFATQIFG